MRNCLSILLVAAALSTAPAQDLTVTQPKGHEVNVDEGALLDNRPKISGLVEEVFKTKKPWQYVNPAAPAKYGSGEKLVSKDFGPGTPYHSTGVVVAGVEW